jgi:hypothetical protein
MEMYIIDNGVVALPLETFKTQRRKSSKSGYKSFHKQFACKTYVYSKARPFVLREAIVNIRHVENQAVWGIAVQL